MAVPFASVVKVGPPTIFTLAFVIGVVPSVTFTFTEPVLEIISTFAISVFVFGAMVKPSLFVCVS